MPGRRRSLPTPQGGLSPRGRPERRLASASGRERGSCVIKIYIKISPPPPGETRCLRCRGCESGGPCSALLHPASQPPSASPSSSSPSTLSPTSTSSTSTSSVSSTSNSVSSSRPPPLAPLGGLSAFSIPRSLGAGAKASSFPSRESSFQPVKPSSERSPETKVWRPY